MYIKKKTFIISSNFVTDVKWLKWIRLCQQGSTFILYDQAKHLMKG